MFQVVVDVCGIARVVISFSFLTFSGRYDFYRCVTTIVVTTYILPKKSESLGAGGHLDQGWGLRAERSCQCLPEVVGRGGARTLHAIALGEGEEVDTGLVKPRHSVDFQHLREPAQRATHHRCRSSRSGKLPGSTRLRRREGHPDRSRTGSGHAHRSSSSPKPQIPCL